MEILNQFKLLPTPADPNDPSQREEYLKYSQVTMTLEELMKVRNNINSSLNYSSIQKQYREWMRDQLINYLNNLQLN